MQRPLIPQKLRLPKAKPGYVPVLQDHAGERDAIVGLKALTPEALSNVMPLFEIVGRSKPLSRDAARAHVKRIFEAVGKDMPIYLDFLRVDPTRMLPTPKGNKTTAEVVFEAAKQRKLAFVPVVPTTSDSTFVNIAANIAISEGRGLALRYPLIGRADKPGHSPHEGLKKLVSALQLPPEELDLLLDLGYLDPDIELRPERLASLITSVGGILKWRRMILLGSSIPAVMSCIPEGESGHIDRQEWLLWKELPDEIRSKVDFGDYGVQHPRPPKGGQGMRANIRYSLDESHFVVRGRGEFRIEGAAQYVRLCQEIIGSGHFAGEFYSWGDRRIQLCADRKIPPGSQTTWRGAGMAHHIKKVTEQLQNY